MKRFAAVPTAFALSLDRGTELLRNIRIIALAPLAAYR